MLLRDPKYVPLHKANGDHFCRVALEGDDDPSVIIFNGNVFMAVEDDDGNEIFQEVDFTVVGGHAAMPSAP